ncbi:MAG TPA: hypothetical protein PLD20_05785 [Blastocatellia bacterium]|nr:hypothetical protein [Blastocatellia bacterium]HMV87615.1 hypothetical protein [Blastocatellia bacterium]HMX24721.1 hypothetical protein [Blastocatellia bacterium]HMY74917.1 hypothetical protein [Blastocatellia bacterium]HMZ17418.1 hypothetical protein [Blastocatellia bacterium]
MQTPFAISKTGNVEIVDPLHPDVIKLFRDRRPYKLNVPLIWPAPRTVGQGLQQPTQERRFSLLILGAQSALNYSLVRLRNATTDDYYSNDFVPMFSVAGGSSGDREEYQWSSWIYLPAQTQLVVEAILGETSPGSGTAEPDGAITFHCVVING